MVIKFLVMYDVIVVGGGPAGLTAAMYSARYGLNVLFFETIDPVSQLSLAPVIENYPGFEGSGMDLLNKIKEQTIKAGANGLFEKVIGLQRSNEGFTVKTENGEYKTKALIIATGGKHRELGVDGEKELVGKGVSYCATCDGPFFKGKRVAVIGGGNAAVGEAIYLKNIGCDVFVVHRRDELRADKVMQDVLFSKDIPVVWNSIVRRIEGKDKVERIVVYNKVTEEEKTIDVDGVFIAVGVQPATEIVTDLGVERDSKGYIKVDKFQRTNVDGVFAAGDCCDNPLNQVVTACGSGAVAANSAYRFVTGVEF